MGGGGLFRFADGVDKLFMFLGTLGCIGDGLLMPVNMLILGGMLNSYGDADASFGYRKVNEYAFRLLIVAVVIAAAAFVEGVFWTRTAERQASRMRMEYLRSVLRQDVGYFDTNAATSTTYEVVTAISTDAHAIQDVLADKIPSFLSNLSALIFSLVAAFLLSWRLALAALPFSLIYTVPGVVFGKFMMDIAGQMKEAYGVAGGAAEQTISSIRTVLSFVGESKTLEKFSQALELSTELGVKLGLMKGLAIGSMGMIFAVWSYQAWIGTILVTEKGASGGNVFISGICVIYGGLAVMMALPNLTFFAGAVAASTRIFEMVDRKPAIDSEDERGIILEDVRGNIDFKRVHFSYPSRPDSPVLQDFNLKVRAGMTVGLVGGSGSGKSTTISLLQRFYDPVKGDILLDGTSIKSLKLKWWRSQMGLVSQEPVLFATSIKENILFGNETASTDLVVSAAKDANAHDFITKLPDGYETQVGQFGFQMSGGQKQRIAIARALLKDPKIILLDEATSALDTQSERVVQDALDQASVGRTTIIIAHRLSTLRNADTIVVLESGKLIESGTHDQLMQIKNGEGAYSKMVQLQQSAGVPITTYRRAETPSINMIMNSPYSPYSSLKTSRYSSPAHSFMQEGGFSEINEEDYKEFLPPSPSQWRLLKMNAPEWKNALMGCLGAMTYGGIQTIHSFCLGAVLSVYFLDDDDLIRSRSRKFCFIFLIIGLITVVANVIQHYNFAVMGEKLTKRVREKMLEKMLSFEVGWFDQDENTTGAICARIATEANVVRSIVGDRLSLILQVATTAVSAFVTALVITWRLAIVLLAVQPLLVGSIYARSKLMNSMSFQAQKAQADGTQLASEAVVNHRTITAFSSQRRILGLYEQALTVPRKESIKQSWFAGIGLFVSQFLTTASIALTFWYGGRLKIEGKISNKHLFEAFFILMSTAKLIADAGTMSSDLAKGGNAVRSVFAILDRRSEIEPDDPNGMKPRKIKGQVELKSVVFAYPARPDQIIFKALSLKIDAGKTVALVGQSGSGKSTIIGLIERFYDPMKGSVEIDGHDIKTYNLRYIRSQIALVSQEPTLFAGTIRENITYGRENASESEIMEAAAQANAQEFISSMKDGYDTYCGERGVQLSGGQKQRIALARAILKKPSILLLDEATSALDSVSESLVQQALDKMMVGRTCIVVAHRLSTVQKANTIAVIKNGKIAEKGSHSELLSVGRNGAYYSLIKLQQGNASPIVA
ncbi:putative multidrug resistance protein [Aristolochia californica]|uniref:putative multidrug resistance protein n=1 Tax=Aristolochia californica TaxID=171875 RepID=UPI0035DF0350